MIDRLESRGRMGVVTRNRLRIMRSGAAVGAAALIGMSCGTADPTPSNAVSSNPYLALRLNTHTIIMSVVAPYDTVRLVATPYLASGQVLQTSGTPIFSSNDPAVSVSATGLLHAESVNSGVYIAVALQDPATHVTHVDTALVVVTDQTPAVPLSHFSIVPLPGDSAYLAAATGGYPQDTVLVSGRGTGGAEITPELIVRYSTSDPNTAVVDPNFGVVTGMKPGRVVITANTTYYGVTQQDSVALTITDPIRMAVLLQQVGTAADGSRMYGLSPTKTVIGVGGTVIFGFMLLTPGNPILDVVFDDPSAAHASPAPIQFVSARPDSGNIAPIRLPPVDSIFSVCVDPNHFDYGLVNCFAARAFTAPGTYRYHSGRYGSAGTIVVRGR